MRTVVYTESGGKHYIDDSLVLSDEKEIKLHQKRIEDISRDILIEEYKKTGKMSGTVVGKNLHKTKSCSR